MNAIEKAVKSLAKKVENKAASDVRAADIENDHAVFDNIHLDTDGIVGSRASSVDSHSKLPKKAASKKTLIKLPLRKLRSLGMVTPDRPRSRVAEEFRYVKRPILMNIDNPRQADSNLNNIIMVTSSVEGEGKTYTSINLAMSIATEMEKTVLLVDTDVVKSSLGSTLRVPAAYPGLIDVLLNDQLDVSDVILQTDIPNLRLIPAGFKSDHSTELLASQGMENLIRELSRRYTNRVILFDSPPILQTNEAKVLANIVGQIVFVVAAEDTSQDVVNEALSHLRKDRSIGLVLNKSRKSSNGGYGYGYQYSKGEQ